MKKILYEKGPKSLRAGQAGQFKRGEAREVKDTLAELLLSRKDIKFREEKPSPKKG